MSDHMLTPALMLRAARHDLERSPGGGWNRLGVEKCIVNRDSAGRWWWAPEDKTQIEVIQGPRYRSEVEALGLALDWLDTQHPEPKPPEPVNLAQLSLSSALAVALDKALEDETLPQALEAQLSAALHRFPEAFQRIVGAAKVAEAWHLGVRYRFPSRTDFAAWVRKIQAAEGGDLWQYWAEGMPNRYERPLVAPTDREAMAIVDAYLAGERWGLMGGPVLLETQPEPDATDYADTSFGAEPSTRCPTCNGTGEWVDPVSRYGIGSRCRECNGSGLASAAGAP